MGQSYSLTWRLHNPERLFAVSASYVRYSLSLEVWGCVLSYVVCPLLEGGPCPPEPVSLHVSGTMTDPVLLGFHAGTFAP